MKYRDAWTPFTSLFQRFWPDCPYPVQWITDEHDRTASWCKVLADFAASSDSPVILFQEDMFLSALVKQHLIEYGIAQFEAHKAGCVRFYPCPGSDSDYGDPYFGVVNRGTRYRISTQLAVWRPSFLYAIASRLNTPQQFELEGTKLAESLPDEVLAFKRDVQPWPVEYICTSIVSGSWNPDALRLCASHGILVDRSMRPVL